MQSVERVHGWWVLRACGRNPLVRGIDRLELLIITVGVLVVLVAAALAGALGTAVHDARSRVYIAQAQTRHTVTARYVVDASGMSGREPAEDLLAVREEVRRFDPALLERPQLVAATKRDAVSDPDPLPALSRQARALGLEVLPVSAVTGQGLPELKRALLQMIEASRLAAEAEPAHR